ncbi:putative Zn-finger containing protein [Candidatus Methylacidithermus pantelleriae]|uniref:Putative Zn-finger containing protein n=1 Tax=Candidatus Methylacidithermus pantelleriae TaxID=2744239 RepID=A0A8J2BIA6_9BACT|nr:putative Zn-finger containing protein [Candidatus Methylacidithermus pantelleriae]
MSLSKFLVSYAFLSLASAAIAWSYFEWRAYRQQLSQRRIRVCPFCRARYVSEPSPWRVRCPRCSGLQEPENPSLEV